MTRRLLLNLGTFGALTVLLVGYGVTRLIDNPLRDERRISTVFPHAAGVRPGFSASLDGVVVGVVRDVELVDDGVRVTVGLDPGVRIPGDVTARVVRASPVGEQRVEFRPTKRGTGPPLDDGDTVPAAPDAVPPDISGVIDALSRLIEHVPAGDLETVVGELAEALRGRGDDLRRLTEAADVFNRELLRNEASFRSLLSDAPPVLDAVSDAGPSLRRAVAATRVLAEVLAERRFDLVELYRQSAALGAVGGDIVGTQKANLACFTSDLADLNRFVAQPRVLGNVSRGLALNRSFFVPVDSIAPYGPAKDVGLGAPDRDVQYWLRVRLLVPPQPPPAQAYVQPRPTPETRPGAACESAFGRGVGPASQPGPPAALAGGRIDPPGSRPATPGNDLAGTATVARSDPLLAVLGLAVLVCGERVATAVRLRRRRAGRG